MKYHKEEKTYKKKIIKKKQTKVKKKIRFCWRKNKEFRARLKTTLFKF